jgi:hypothetical protein
MDMSGKLIIHDIRNSIKKRGLETGGKVQKFIDSEVLRVTDPYVPMDTGTLKSSGIRNTTIGEGKVIYRTPYARKLYYNPQFNYQGAPMRGGKWFERMKIDHKDSILKGASQIAGARSGGK